MDRLSACSEGHLSGFFASALDIERSGSLAEPGTIMPVLFGKMILKTF